MLQTYTLSNGLKVATYNLPQLRSIHLQLSSRGGSLVETKADNGVAHFMEHLLVQGIPSYPNVEEFSQFIERLAGNYGAYTDSLSVGFQLTLPRTHIQDAVKICSEVFFTPLFVEDAVDKERGVIVEELVQRQASHWHKVNYFFRKSRFGEEHPLTLNPGGSIEVVNKTTRQDLLEYWQKYFVPNNITLLVSGSFDPKQLKDLLESYFGKYPKGQEFSGFPKMSRKDFSKRKVAIRHDSNLGSNHVDFAFPALSLDDPLFLRIQENIALVILGELRNSRLFKLLRYTKGLVYDVSAGASTWPGLGYVYISSEVSNEHLDEVVSLISQELAAYIEHGPTEEEVEFVKYYLSNQWLMSFDHPSAIAAWIENDLSENDGVRLPEEYIEMIKDIKASDIQKLMQDHWDVHQLIVTIQGPVRDSLENRTHFAELVSGLK